MEQEEYCISVGEPWNFESQDGQNVIKGYIVNILILTTRYKESYFSNLTREAVGVNGGIFLRKYDEKLCENELEQNIKFEIIGSIRKVENSI